MIDISMNDYRYKHLIFIILTKSVMPKAKIDFAGKQKIYILTSLQII